MMSWRISIGGDHGGRAGNQEEEVAMGATLNRPVCSTSTMERGCCDRFKSWGKEYRNDAMHSIRFPHQPIGTAPGPGA